MARDAVQLLNALRVTFRTNEGVEDSQNVPPVIHHSRENVTELGIAFRLTMPLCENYCGNLDVSAEFVGGVTAKKQSIEKSGLALWEVEVVNDFRRNELGQSGHEKNAVYPKVVRRQVELGSKCSVPGNCPSKRSLSRHGDHATQQLPGRF
jgi:hypothetical protein